VVVSGTRLDGILTAIDAAPDACEPVRWGKRLAAVAVSLPRRGRAPARVADWRFGAETAGASARPL